MKLTLLLLTALTAIPAAAQTIPANTYITVRTIDNIEGRTASAGRRFRATVDEPVNANGPGSNSDRLSGDSGSGGCRLGQSCLACAGHYHQQPRDSRINNRCRHHGHGHQPDPILRTARRRARSAGRGRQLNVPPETRLRLALTSAVTVR